MIAQISPAQLSAWQASLAPEAKPVLLDVREPWEVQTASVKPAGFEWLAMPMREIPGRLAELNPDQPVACLCHHGMRSQQVAHYLLQNGFADVVNIQGGIDAWSALDASVPRY